MSGQAVLGVGISLLVVAIPVAVVVLAVRSARGGEPSRERASWSLRRFLQYGFLLAAVFVTATGLSMVLGYALPEGPRLAGRATADLALGLSLALVGGPVWAALGRLVSRHLAADPVERASLAWNLYLSAAATISLVVALVGLVGLGAWAVGAAEFDRSGTAAGIAYGAAWVLHAWLWRHRSWGAQGRLAPLVPLAGSAVGVVALAAGAAGVLHFGLQRVYEAASGVDVLGAGTAAGAVPEPLRHSVVLAILASAVWWWHWLRGASRGPYDTFWHVYVMLIPILGGLLTATVSAAIGLHALVSWLLGVPGSERAAVQFDVLPGVLAAGAVGIWAWWYHRWVLAERTRPEGVAPEGTESERDAPEGTEPGRAEPERTEPERAYRYLVAAVGLVAAAAGLTVALVTAIHVLGPVPLAAGDPRGRETLAVAITLLVVGVPLWGLFWRDLQRRARTHPAEEVGSASRRAYLFLLFGASALTAITSLVVILYVLLRDLLEAQLTAGALHELRVALALTVTAGALTGYHWSVYREDRQVGGRQPALVRTVLLVTGTGPGAAEEIAARTGATVRALHRLDAVTSSWDPERVAAAVLATPHEHVLVVADGDGDVRVIPYESA